MSVSSNSGAEWSTFTLPFTYVAYQPTLTSIIPPRGPVYGGTPITAIGSNFTKSSSSAVCRFGSVTSPAKWVSSTTISCTSPAANSAGNVGLAVSDNAVQFTGTANFTYEDPLTYISVSPTNGTVLGGTIVTIAAISFVNSSLSMWCQFIGTPNAIVLATFLTSSSVSCRTPSQATPGSVTIKVTDNIGRDFTGLGIVFAYTANPQILTVSPSSAPANGRSSWANITGVGFAPSSALRCRYGGAQLSVQTVYVSSTSVRCLSPVIVSPQSSAMFIEVTLNGVDYTSGQVAYYFTSLPVISSLSLSRGALTGGSLLTIRGSYFTATQDMVCKFGATQFITATVTSSTELVCRTPSVSVPGLVTVEISSNAQDYSAQGFTFMYVATPRVTSTIPDHGKSKGGTVVTVLGVAFGNVTSCVFGGIIVSASTINSSSVICTTPGGMPNTEASLEVSVNSGADVSVSSPQVTFLYRDFPVITDFFPRSKPVAGGGSSVNVTGTGFRLPTVLLSFAGVHNPVAATFISSTVVRVTVPPVVSPGPVIVEVSTNGQEFSDYGKTFLYDPNLSVTSVIPSHGGLSGGYPVTVFGSGFMNATHATTLGTLCRFGTVVTSSYRYLTATSAVCTAPASASGTGAVHVDLTSNGVDFSSSTVLFTYLVDPTIVSIVPNYGSLSGGTLLSIACAGVSNASTLLCCFDSTWFLPATFRNSTLIQCRTPTLNASTSLLRITSNGWQWSLPITYFTQMDPNITSIFPNLVDPYRSGTLLTISGSNFVQRAADT